MFHQVLEVLKTDDFPLRFSFTSNARLIHRALQRSKEVQDLRDALRKGEVTEDTIRLYCAELLRELNFGRRFHHEFALAGLAVALEARPTSFAEEFVQDLARLELAELPIAIRVSRESCRERRKLSSNKTKIISWCEHSVPLTEWPSPREIPRVKVGQSNQHVQLGAL